MYKKRACEVLYAPLYSIFYKSFFVLPYKIFQLPKKVIRKKIFES